MQDCIEKLSNANKILYNNIDLYYYAKFYETYFNATLNSVDSSYIISYFYFDKKVSQIVNRYIA